MLKSPKEQKPRSGNAIVSFLLGLFFWMPLFNFFLGPAAIYLGIKALHEIRDKGNRSGKIFALAGIVLGTLPICFGVIYVLWNYLKVAPDIIMLLGFIVPLLTAVVALVVMKKHRLL